MITLRDYQQQWITDIKQAMSRHRRVLAVMPTGAGKTICFSAITQGALAKDRRVLVLVHRALILDQISDALHKFDVPHGRIEPGHPASADSVQIAMVQTYARRHERYGVPDLVIIDEAHHAVSATYARVLALYPQAFILGVTATPLRLDGRGLGALFDALVLGPTVADLIARGYLADYEYFAPQPLVDLSAVRIVTGDYQRDDLAGALDKPKITGSAVGHYKTHAEGRPSIWFCVSLAHAEHVAAEFQAAGYQAASIDGSMDAGERRARLHGLADGSLQVLTSCDLIGEGVDVPAVSVIGHLRPTKSLAMKKQFDGRGLRLKPDGSKAMIFDHVGNHVLHGTPRTPVEWSLDSKRRKVSFRAEGVRQCLGCYRVLSVGEPVECAERLPGCLAAKDTVFVGREIDTTDGVLVTLSDQPEWAHGASLTLARGDEFRALVQAATTREQLRVIARARGYNPRWVEHVLKSRGGSRHAVR